MQTLPIRQRAAAFGLAAIVTFVNAATLNTAVSHEHLAPSPLLAGTDAGCDFNPRQPC